MFDQIYLTGFKIFGGHEVNPTQLLAQHFGKINIPNLTCQLMEVATKPVDEYVDKIKKCVDEQCGGKKVLNLHFGVGPNIIYHLQRCCYNTKDFRIPDNLKYQPRNEQICPNQALDYPIFSKLDLASIHKQLSKEFPCQLSLDPGRYLCNYIYFKTSHDISINNENACSLFVHFPDLSITSHEKNVAFVERLLGILLKKGNKEKEKEGEKGEEKEKEGESK